MKFSKPVKNDSELWEIAFPDGETIKAEGHDGVCVEEIFTLYDGEGNEIFCAHLKNVKYIKRLK